MIGELLLIADVVALRYVNNKRLEYQTVKDYELRVGYKSTLFYKEPIIVDMQITPHLFVCGLSGSGKTKMVENAVRGKDVVLINVFEDDFKNVDGLRIVGNKNILGYLEKLLETMKARKKDSKPLFLVLDELLVLCIDKAITKAITDILAIGRHYNVYIIGISQIGTKESVKFKDLFNARVCFRQVEESSYRTILGYSPEDKNLRQREFYLYSDEIAKGRTYKVK